MAPPRATKIPREVWTRHEKTIRDLFYKERLPLFRKGNGESVQSRLQSDHSFTVSPSQLEAYIKSYGEPKNLKKEEWRAVHMRLNKLSAMRIVTRVSLSGKVFSKPQLLRSKRFADPPCEDENPNGFPLPLPKGVLIETQKENKNWTVLTDEDMVRCTDALHTTSNRTLSTTKAPTLAGNGGMVASSHLELDVLLDFGRPTTHDGSIPEVDNASEITFLPLEHQALISYYSPAQQAESSWSPIRRSPVQFFQALATELDLPTFDMQSPGGWSTFYNSRYLPQESPFSRLREVFLARSTWSNLSEPQSRQIIEGGEEREMKLNRRLPPSSQMSLVQSLLQEGSRSLTGEFVADNLEKLPSFNTVQDCLLSLLPDSMQQDQYGDMQAIVAENGLFDLPFYNALLYSIANGFAGLNGIPPGAILRMLKKNHCMSDQIIKCLKYCPPSQAKCLADNLFRAAIEAADEEALKFIIETTQDLPCSIKVNDIVCKINNSGISYTAVELAAKFRHLGIVQILLAANADVNKTYGRSPCGALEYAICKKGKEDVWELDFITDQPVDMPLVRAILRHGSRLRLTLFEAIIWHNPVDLLRELFLRFPPARHQEFFQQTDLSSNIREKNELLVIIAMRVENNLATEIFIRLLVHCREMNCMRCIERYQELLERILCVAVRRANLELVTFLQPFTGRQDGALAAAIRSGSHELIGFFMSKGSGANSPVCCIDGHRMKLPKRHCRTDCSSRSTPLAEAILAQDKDLLQELENRGVLSHIHDPDHFRCALNAAAKAGDHLYIDKLLQLTQMKHCLNVRFALCAAIRTENMKVVVSLLESGCLFGSELELLRDSLEVEVPLFVALDTKNKPAFHAILEADISGDVNELFYDDFTSKSVLELAALWGDTSIVRDLIMMGANLDDGHEDTALRVALKSKNIQMTKLLLEAGASPDACALNGRETPLGTAIEHLNTDAVQLLLHYGASVADEWAFEVALDKSQATFDELLRAFSCRYPYGRRGFGADLLNSALARHDATLLNKMLSAHFDTKAFGQDKFWKWTALGATISHARSENGVPTVTQILIDREDVNSIVMRSGLLSYGEPRIQETALLAAIETRNEQVVKLLLEKGADVHRPAQRGIKRTPLQKACEIGSFKMVKLLIEHGARIDEEPAYSGGRTALQLAAIAGSIKIAELLIQRGAHVHEAPSTLHGQTAFEGAAKNGRIEMLRLLWDTVGGEGFVFEQIEDAKSLAVDEGYQGCADYIDSLWEMHISFNL